MAKYTAVTAWRADPECVNPGNVINEVRQTPKSTHCVSAFAEIPRTGRVQRQNSLVVMAAEGFRRRGGYGPFLAMV